MSCKVDDITQSSIINQHFKILKECMLANKKFCNNCFKHSYLLSIKVQNKGTK